MVVDPQIMGGNRSGGDVDVQSELHSAIGDRRSHVRRGAEPQLGPAGHTRREDLGVAQRAAEAGGQPGRVVEKRAQIQDLHHLSMRPAQS